MTREFTVAVPGGTITAWQQGDGPHALVLHGGPGMSEYTDKLADELEDGYTVTRIQQRGVAPSTLEGPFDVETHVADTIAVMDDAGIEKAFLLGHSWGGHLAMHLAVAHQDRFLGLLPIDPLGGVGDGGSEEMDQIMTARVGPEALARAEELDALAMAGSDEAALEFMRIMWVGYFASPEKVTPMPDFRFSAPCNDDTYASVVRHFEAQTLAGGLPGVELPTLFLLGADSPIRPQHNIDTAALLPDATYELASTGHVIWLEQPGVVRRALDDLAVRVAARTA
jgi:proline iminopeptidase